ncbi:hypothetical protein YB2330_001086 [Saitoella coloradoensis]
MYTQTLDLNTASWSFHYEDEWFPCAHTPSQIHLELLSAGKIPDPFDAMNEKDLQWIGERDWTYRCEFKIPELEHDEEEVGLKTVLVFEGLDTFATVTLDGNEIVKSDNQFHTHRIPTSNLTPGRIHTLTLNFSSALRHGHELLHKHANRALWNGDASRLYVRKAPYHYGWDWGPVLMTCGPWREVRVERYAGRLVDVVARVKVSEDLGSAVLGVEVQTEGVESGDVVTIQLFSPEGDLVVDRRDVRVKDDGKGWTEVTLKDPELWWPHSLGTQPLYELRAVLTSPSSLFTTHTLTRPLGLRRAKLIQRPLKNGRPGTTFHFEINGIPIFVPGADWIPADSFTCRLTDKDYEGWIDLAVRGGHAMLRVWGGGIYESEAFYRACDEKGVLVWQDILFACGQYPAHPEFLSSVEREVREELARLRHHPSIVLVCGNNEDYMLAEQLKLEYDPEDTNPESWLKSNFPARWIYEKLLPECVEDVAPHIDYHPGSPWGGKDTMDPNGGDLHQWNVWHGSQAPYQTYPSLGGRFVSEFGMQAAPDPRTIKSFTNTLNPAEIYPQSAVMDHHNKADGHEKRLGGYLLENFRWKDDIPGWSYATQLLQSEALSTAYRHWRRAWRGEGREECGGVLVWQLNDCWPCTSWAIVDYEKRAKMAWFTIRRELATISVGVERVEKKKEGGGEKVLKGAMDGQPGQPFNYAERKVGLNAWACNASLESVSAIFQLRAYKVKSGEELPTLRLRKEVVLAPNSSTEILTEVDAEDADVVYNACLLAPEDDVVFACTSSWPQPFKHNLFPARNVQLTLSPDCTSVTITADRPTKGVWLDVVGDDDRGVKWGDNCLDVFPGDERVVEVEGLEGMEVCVRWYGSDFEKE